MKKIILTIIILLGASCVFAQNITATTRAVVVNNAGVLVAPSAAQFASANNFLISGGNGTVNLGNYSVVLPSDVTRLGPDINLTSETTGNLTWSRVSDKPVFIAGDGISFAGNFSSAGNFTIALMENAARDNLTGKSGILNLANYTLTLPSDVTRLGNVINLSNNATTNGELPVFRGGTGANTAAAARFNLGLADIDVTGAFPVVKSGSVLSGNAVIGVKLQTSREAIFLVPANGANMTIGTIGNATCVQFADAVDSPNFEMYLPPVWAGRTARVRAVIAVNNNSAGMLRLRMGARSAPDTFFSGSNGTMLTSFGGGAEVAGSDPGSGANYTAPSTAASPVILQSGNLTIPANSRQIVVFFSARRTHSDDTNTGVLFLQELRVEEN